MSIETRHPKEHIVDTRDRFMDFAGNALNSVLGDYDNLSEEDFSPDMKARTVEHLKSSWKRFFASIEMFLEHDFEPTEAITREKLQEVLAHKDEDPFAIGVVQKVDELYRSIVGLKD